MKIFIKTVILFTIISMNAQVEPLLDHDWVLEKVVIDDEEVMAEPDNYGYYVGISFYGSAQDDFDSFTFDDFFSDITYDNTNQSFTIIDETFGFTMGEFHDTYAAFSFKSPFLFIYENQSYIFYDPFTYEFRYEGDFIYLDVTNTEGDVATFWASTLSNENFDKPQFSLYPNPVDNELNIESEQAKIEQIGIYNLNGKQVLNVNFQKGQPIDVSALSKGVYLVKLQTEEGSLTKKLVK